MSKFWKDALIRAARSFCQSLVTLIGTDAVSIIDIDWLTILGISATYGVISILTSIATGLPETELSKALEYKGENDEQDNPEV